MLISLFLLFLFFPFTDKTMQSIASAHHAIDCFDDRRSKLRTKVN